MWLRSSRWNSGCSRVSSPPADASSDSFSSERKRYLMATVSPLASCRSRYTRPLAPPPASSG
jgi:hypothetical protein